MGYYPAIKGIGVLILVTTWLSLENMMLSEVSQTMKVHILCDSMYWYMKCEEHTNLQRE